ncbi:MAG: helix-turn-helix domain-containing protein [Nanoarchaeota archaeon]|nr:hypothetical protein [Nanoarchaeota archaeon]MBU1445307.1 hypothetical protein [Nanoarchaeota archaeon]MBU2406587.1 hypothetical protein [Nanoarchaeota archaeon]MBU2420503.1 hypothetical protein [Nanoarchaeota archaeon]MBU2475072.1 hypothetical protein [Nanoarchaeota archaeon]
MIMDKDFIKKIRSAFDLNIYEAKIWTALLSKGIAAAGELSDISDVPRSRSYDILESLEKRGFVIMKLGKPIKYIAVEPSEIVLRVKKHIKKSADQQVESLDKIKKEDVFSELSLLYKNGVNHVDAHNVSGAIKGRYNIYNHMETMLKDAKKSVVIMTSSTGIVKKADSLKYTLKKLSEKGVKVKIIAKLESEKAELAAKELAKFADVKRADKIGARFILIDGTQLMFMLNDDKEVHESSDIGIWAHSPAFASTVDSLLKSTWSKLPSV